jgi:hypothetical protein
MKNWRCEMPIKGVSEVRRLPRLGKIRLGIKVEEPRKNPYPRATDYFVLPDGIKHYVGDKPKQLKIMFPVEDPEVFAPQYLKCYSFTQGLVCRGDGVKCTRKVDVFTGNIADHTTERWEFREMTCDPETCPQAVGDPESGIKPQCRRVMNLMFVMPDVPGLGVWQLDTSSFYSIVNINSCIDVIRGLCGRISGVPLILSLEPREVTPPGIKKKTVQVLHLRSELKLTDLQRIARKPQATALMPAAEEEEPPEDLFPEETLVEAETARHQGEGEWPPPEPREEKIPDDVVSEDVPDLNAVFRLCFHFWKMQPEEVCRQLGYKTTMDAYSAGVDPWDAWLTIKKLKQPSSV